jgi:hypothetical protein
VPRRGKYVPKHRGAVAEPTLRKGIRRSILFSGVAVAATGIAVSSGMAFSDGDSGAVASASLSSSHASQQAAPTRQAAGRPAVDLGDRSRMASRSDRRTEVDPVKKRALDQRSGGQVTQTEDLSKRDPRSIARAMLSDFGFSRSQFSCLDALYVSESGWDVHADNPTSSAYGIPQALPGSKMASAGADWAENPATQIRWGLSYIRSSYGTPCNAWAFKQSHQWY